MEKPSLCWWQGVTQRESKRTWVGESWREEERRAGEDGATGEGTLRVRAPVCSSAPSFQPALDLGSYPYGYRTSKTIFFFFLWKNALPYVVSLSVKGFWSPRIKTGAFDWPSPALAKNPAIPQTVIPDHSCYFEFILLHLWCPSPWRQPLAPPI